MQNARTALRSLLCLFLVSLVVSMLCTCSGAGNIATDDSPQAVAPVITTHPASQTVSIGQSATFSVVATGTAPLSYQWRKNGANITGATSAGHTTPAAPIFDNGATYRVVVANAAGSITSNEATLTVQSSQIDPVAPVITTQPTSQSVGIGQSATFSVVATGTAPLNYRWMKNGVDIAGATSASYTTPVAQTTDNGANYTVMVTNTVDSVTSNEATLIVRAGHISPDAQFQDDFNAAIDESKWQIATWAEHGGQTGRERCYTRDGYLNMIFINDSNDGYLSAAIQTWSSFLYGRWEARLKPSSVSGVLNSLYTIDWGGGSGTKQEIDIEFLTFAFGENSGKVHFAVHADGLTSFNTNPDIDLNFNPSDDFHIVGFEITPEHIQWFADDQVLFTYGYSGNPITINSPYQLKLNVWSSVNWINGPPMADTPCIYQIDWIRFYPYDDN